MRCAVVALAASLPLVVTGLSTSPTPPEKTRRLALAAGLSFAAATTTTLPPASAEVSVDPFNSMCLGFGCNSAQGVDRPFGAAKPTDEDSIDWAAFLAALEARQVARVEFDDVRMNKAWAILSDGDLPRRIRVGEGYPVESGQSWSSTLFVARILQNFKVSYTFLGGLKSKGA
mmetsp:Transcript_12882/g.38887  ORF Transcript_12882/g.38887 Transcript_12882/m.38887 type:complete len:173 (-) Transcript_12882:946-1464(-)